MGLQLRFYLILALAVVAPKVAQAQVFYWCVPLKAFYPQVQTCPVPWVRYSSDPMPSYRPDPYDINHSNSKG
jgi:hypothetical protein